MGRRSGLSGGQRQPWSASRREHRSLRNDALKVRAFLILALALALPAYAEHRNVLLIISDDQGRDLGVYGNKALHTPNLDALASRGTLFTEAFATVSSCS